MKHRGHLKSKERQERSRLAQILHGKQFVCGTLVTSQRKCGKNYCWCAKKAEGHVSTYLSVKVGSKWKMVCVPKDKVKQVEAWVKTYKEISRRMIEISNSCLERLRKD